MRSYENPEIYHSRLLAKQQQDAISSLRNQLGPLLSPSVVTQIERSLSGLLDIPALVGTDGNQPIPVKKGEAKKRFGKLMEIYGMWETSVTLVLRGKRCYSFNRVESFHYRLGVV